MKKILKATDFRFFIGCHCHIMDSNNNPGKVSFIIEGVDIYLNKIIIGGLGVTPDVVKPILRTFENLSRHEMEGLNKLWPSENIKRTTFESIQLDANIIDYLTSLNVDVFGWIEQGLAIDAAYNTTK